VSPPTLAEILAEARASGDAGALARAIPFARFMGLEIIREGGRLLGKLPFSAHLVGNAMLPALHGGALGALLESIAIFAVMSEDDSPLPPKTISVTIEYLRSARTVDTFALADIIRQGRRVATVRAHAWQEDESKPVASATVQLLLPPRGSER
jgi:uncharacterized protein (TIGR00369 family)